MMGYSGWATAGMFAMMVGVLVVVAVAATAVVLLIRPVFDGGGRPPVQPANQLVGETETRAEALAILEERYARGEIDRADFLEHRGDLVRQEAVRR